MITQMGFFWEKGSTLLCIPGLGNLVNAFPCYSQLEISWGLYSHVVPNIVNNMGILPLVVSIFGVR